MNSWLTSTSYAASATPLAFCHRASLNSHNCLPPRRTISLTCGIHPNQQYQHYKKYQNINWSRKLNKGKTSFRNLSSSLFAYEPNDDIAPKEEEEASGDQDEEEIEDINDEDEDEDFLDFDDDALLEELMEFSDDFDESLIDIDDELQELERLIDEQTSVAKRNKLISMKNMKEDEDYYEEDGDKNERKIKVEGKRITSKTTSSAALEEALLQGVVPATAGVGSSCLPGDYGFDPFGLSTKDYFKQAQNFLLNLLPSSKDANEGQNNQNIASGGGAALPLYTKPTAPLNDHNRPLALILRDYREAEIRHGRLAMLAAILWPLQEIIDRLFIPQSFGHTTFIYGGVTLPFISLFMTLFMLLLGYLDIYAASIKDSESGDAFLPGECFWDPLSMLEGAPDSMKRRMQERELNNGRIAMVAVFAYILQEAITHEPVINLAWNQVLFEPAFEIPEVQEWLDRQFAGGSVETLNLPADGINDVLGGLDESNNL